MNTKDVIQNSIQMMREARKFSYVEEAVLDSVLQWMEEIDEDYNKAIEVLALAAQSAMEMDDKIKRLNRELSEITERNMQLHRQLEDYRQADFDKLKQDPDARQIFEVNHRTDRKIQDIKDLRAKFNIGLKEAKDLYEWFEANPF